MREKDWIETRNWLADSDPADLQEAAAALAAGGVVAFPTETVYGLGADARNTEAVSRIFTAKGRPSDNPLIVHLASEEALDELVERVSDTERKLIRACWPGPLTLVLPVREGAVSPLVTAGLDTVAVRVPAHDVARRLIALSGCPIAAPSANRSGRPSPTEAAHVLEDLSGRIDGVVDGGTTGIGLESTVVRVVGDAIHILRPGGVTGEQLQRIAGPGARIADPVGGTSAGERDADAGAKAATGTWFAAAGGESPAHVRGEADGADSVAVAAPDDDRPRSPGVKYKHYAPRGAMLLVVGRSPERIVAAVREAAGEARRAGRKVGILASAEHAGRYAGFADEVLVSGSRQAPEEAARRLYALLRECDRRGVGAIVAEGFPEAGIGAALMNRMRKAAGGRVREV